MYSSIFTLNTLSNLIEYLQAYLNSTQWNLNSLYSTYRITHENVNLNIG